jgi:Rrf2 family protein
MVLPGENVPQGGRCLKAEKGTLWVAFPDFAAERDSRAGAASSDGGILPDMGLRVTNAADYAIRAMIHMACLPEEGIALRGDIARIHGIPSSFMAKILRSLVKAGLLKSMRGVHGGFALARPTTEISLLDVVEAIEGPLGLLDCTQDPCACELADECPAQPVWAAVQAQMASVLRAATLEDLVAAPRRKKLGLAEIERRAT